MTKTKKFGLVFIILLLIAAAIGTAFFVTQYDAEVGSLETTVAQKGTVIETVEVTGAVSYPLTKEAAFLTTGIVEKINVEVGDIVEKGELLATLKNQSGATLLKEQQDMLRLTAPMSGIITALHTEVGEIAPAGAPFAVIEGPADIFEVTVQIPENDVAKTSVGDKATITVEALGNDGVFVGKVLHIAPTATPIEGLVSYTAFISIDYGVDSSKGSFEQLRAGMTADVAIVTAESKNAIFVPRRAVITIDGKTYVRVPTDNEAGYEEREVTTGLRDDEGNIAIVRGLSVDETVITKIND